MSNRLFSLCLSLCVGISVADALTVESASGSLASLVAEENRHESSLTITGTIDARDFAVLEELFPNLTSLNIRDVTITGYTSDRLLNGKTHFEANRLPDQAFFGMKLTDIVLPQGLTAVGDGAFAANPIKSIEIPVKVSEIGSYAFYDCDRLVTVCLPAEVGKVGDYVFGECESLTTIDFAMTKIEKIEGFSFFNCEVLQEVRLPESLTDICDSAFAGCTALKNINLPEGLRQIGDNAFLGCGLEQISIGRSVRRIGDFAFAHCQSLQSVEAAGELIDYGRGAFFYCPSLQTMSLVASTIPDYAFAGSRLLTVSSEMMSATKEIGDYALLDNKSGEITLPSTLTHIGDNAMQGMDALRLIDVTALEERVPLTGEDVFEGIRQSKVTLRVADTTDEVWRSALQWKEFNIVDYTTVVKIESDKRPIRVWFDRTNLFISSSDVMRKVSVYEVAGRCVATFEPCNTSAQYEVVDLNADIYIVVVATDNEVASFKLIR